MARKFKNIDIDIGPVAISILREIANRGSASVYQIFLRRKRSTSLGMAYKNIHKRVQRLKELGFIERVNRKETEHKAIFYRLSEAGIFYYFLKAENVPFILTVPSILANYSDCAFLEVFVYPYFDKATLVGIKEISRFNLQVVVGLFQYLKECSEQVNYILAVRRKDKLGPALQADMKLIIREFYQSLEFMLEKTEYSKGLSYLFRVFIFRVILAAGNLGDDKDNTLKIFNHDKKFVNATEILNDEYRRGYGRLKQHL